MKVITEKISQDQTAHLSMFIEYVIRKFVRSKDEAKMLISNFSLLEKDFKKVFEKYSSLDKRFGSPFKEFEVIIPLNYRHEKQLESFTKANKMKFYYYNHASNDENFINASTELKPGKSYTVKLFQILSVVTSEECLNFLKDQRALLVNGQGLSLVWDLKKDELPEEMFTVSLDDRDRLWRDGNNIRVPRIYRYSDGDWGFGLGSFENEFTSRHCLLCFCDS